MKQNTYLPLVKCSCQKPLAINGTVVKSDEFSFQLATMHEHKNLFQAEEQQCQQLYGMSVNVCMQFARHISTILIAVSYSVLKLASLPPPPRRKNDYFQTDWFVWVFLRKT